MCKGRPTLSISSGRNLAAGVSELSTPVTTPDVGPSTVTLGTCGSRKDIANT
jgi:hypothetical protein